MDDTWHRDDEDDLYMMQSGTLDEDEFVVIPKTAPSPRVADVEPRPVPALQSDDRNDRNSRPNTASMSLRRTQEASSMSEIHTKNRDLVSQQCPQLRKNGVLMVGSVLSAKLSPSTEYDSSNAPTSFRVLFVEGGTQPMTFRCKTPVYTSAAVSGNGDRPIWPDNTFRFDMILPEPVLSGDIMISVYRARPSGGSDLVGSALFGLQQIEKTGTIEFFSKSIEGRSLSGKHLLLAADQSRHSGEAEIQLNMAWRPLDRPLPAELPSAARARPNSGVPTSTVIPVGASSTAPSRPRSASASRRSVAGGPRPASPPRKIVSKFLLKQQKDARKINAENKKLQQVLEQRGAKNSAHAATYQADAKPAPLRVPSIAEAKSVASAARHQVVEDKETTRVLRLKDMHDQLKRSNAELELEIGALRAKVSNLSIQSHKARGGLERSRLAAPSALATIASGKAVASASTRGGGDEFRDLEYQQVKEEYDIVQGIRRGFLERIVRAKAMAVGASRSQDTVQRDHDVLLRRVLGLSDEFPAFFTTHGQSLSQSLAGGAGVGGEEDEGGLLYSQLTSAMGDLSDAQALRQFDSGDDMSLLSARRELEAILSNLQGKIRVVHGEVDALRRQQEDAAASVQQQVAVKELQLKKDFIVRLKATELRLIGEQKKKELTQAFKKNEVSLLRLKMLASERAANGGHVDEFKL